MKKKYYITSNHVLERDSYTEGVTEWVNEYNYDEIVVAEDPVEALKTYYNRHLHWDLDGASIGTNGYDLFDSRLVDSDGCVATEHQIERWKAGELELFNDNVSIQVHTIEWVDYNWPEALKK